MVKRNSVKPRSKGLRKAKQSNSKRARSMRLGTNSMLLLDKAALDHVRLMADPCQGRLVPPAYAQPGGGSLMRLRKTFSLAVGATETAGVFHWVPALNEHYINGAASSTTTFTPASTTTFPSLQFSAAAVTTNQFRCVAACVRVLSNASEMNRSGYLYAGQTSKGYYGTNGAAVVTTDTAGAGLPVLARVPAQCLEVLWSPGNNDQSFFNDNVGTVNIVESNFTNPSAITICATGLPATVGVTIEVTAVYEINFASGSGFVTSNPAPTSTTPWNIVLQAFYKAIHNAPVVVDTVRKTTEYLGAALSSTPGRQLATGVARLALTM